MQHKLVLFKRDTCPFCMTVMQYIEEHDIDVTMRDISRDADARRELEDKGGKTQVPCLFIDGKPLYESDDIIAWLREHMGAP